jgi:DNA-binding NarL/FixJ family response regulator/signal transduction histidine kinase
VCFPWNQGTSTYFVYAAAFLPFMIPSARTVLALIVAEVLLIAAEGAVCTLYVPHGPFHVGWGNTIFAIFLTIVIGCGNIYFADQKRADRKLRAVLQDNVGLAAVAERERIARDLHDVLGHTLSVIVLKAELAGRLVAIDPERAVAEMGDVERTGRAALAEIREAIGGYRSRGLLAEIEAARATLGAAGVTLDAQSAPGNTLETIKAARLTSQEETALALVLREAVTNIVRHARATTCRLRFDNEAGQRRLVVEDDGQHAAAREGNGLRGMRERVPGAPIRTPITVLLAEDQTMLRGALAALLDLEPDIHVIAQAADGREALKLALASVPDVLVTDIEMPEQTGLEVAASLKLANAKTRVIILTTFARPGYLRRALDAGARGYLLKDRPASELAEAIRRVHAGLRAIDPALAAEAWGAEADPLNDRQRRILQWAGEGRSTAEIATELRLSEGTVRNYLSDAMAKLGAVNRVDAARIARSLGWL